jgi:hypothetical protein
MNMTVIKIQTKLEFVITRVVHDEITSTNYT